MNESHINGVYELSKECFAIPWTLDSINNELNNSLAKYVIAQDLSTKEVIGFAKKPFLNESLPKESIEIMKGIKLAFDPKNILNPGKVCQ